MTTSRKSPGAVIAGRLAAHGVTFVQGVPVRAHSRRHGLERDTFLVDAEGASELGCRWNGGQWRECAIEGTAKDLARSTIYVCETDSYSGYGLGLWLTASEPRRSLGRQRLLFVMTVQEHSS